MENNEMAMRTNDIIASLTYYRLLTSLDITNTNISTNAIRAENVDSNFIKKALVRTDNYFKKDYLATLAKEKTKTEAMITKFKRNCLENTIYQYGESEEELRKELEDFFKNDHDDYLKYQIALTTIIDNRYPHEHENETLKKLSTLLFGDEEVVVKLKKSLNKNLKKLLSDETLKKVGKIVLISSAIAAVATFSVVMAATSLTASQSSNTRQCLANLAHRGAQEWMPGALHAAGSLAVLAGLSCAGIIASSNIQRICEDEKAFKEAFRALKPSDMAATLAIRLTLLEWTKDKATKDQLKEYKDAVLKDVDYIRSDSEYLYIIEHSDERNSKSKADICNKMVTCLAGI